MAYKKKSIISKTSKSFKKYSKFSKPKMTPRTATTVIKNYVKNQLAKAIENKISTSSKYELEVMKYIATDPVFFVAQYSTFFNLSQGVDQGQRVGNTIKLKKWIIKGFVTPVQILPPDIARAPFDQAGLQGTVKLMLLKTRNNIGVDSALSQLLQNGNASQNPLGQQFDKLMPINTDKYKVYWERSYKMGAAAANGTVGALQYYPTQANNDFKLNESFYLDVTNYIGKDAKITYNDATTQAIVPGFMTNLALVAMWSPFTGNMTQSSTFYSTFFKVSTVSYFEYEDA